MAKIRNYFKMYVNLKRNISFGRVVIGTSKLRNRDLKSKGNGYLGLQIWEGVVLHGK